MEIRIWSKEALVAWAEKFPDDTVIIMPPSGLHGKVSYRPATKGAMAVITAAIRATFPARMMRRDGSVDGILEFHRADIWWMSREEAERVLDLPWIESILDGPSVGAEETKR